MIMGVSGCGKSTVGALLAGRLRWPFEDADWFHPPANVEKMRKSIALTDEDRWPWLNARCPPSARWRWVSIVKADGLEIAIFLPRA